eukprot:Nitzschia sp. Nitz4//scaffold161_size51353//32214//32837//NITZ4_006951-RA/size51353-processed-gene-0.61-mRNA-1//1//CDS//3329537918//9129//frame0
MPKVGKNAKLHRKARQVAATSPLGSLAKNAKVEEAQVEDATNKEGEALSRGQRKRMAKREQYLKKEKLILSTLLLKKEMDQKRRIDGLDAIRNALMDTTKQDDTAEEQQDESNPSYGSNRAKRNLVTNEVERLGLVMQHPQFQQDPFATIQEHLKNSFANQRTKLETQSKERSEQDRIQEEEKKRLKKERLEGVKKRNKKYKPRRNI